MGGGGGGAQWGAKRGDLTLLARPSEFLLLKVSRGKLIYPSDEDELPALHIDRAKMIGPHVEPPFFDSMEAQSHQVES